MPELERIPQDNDPSAIFGRSEGRKMYFDLSMISGHDSTVTVEAAAAGAIEIAAHWLGRDEIDTEIATQALVRQLSREAGAERLQ